MLSLAEARRCGLIAMRSRSLNGALWMPSYDGPGSTDAGQSLLELQQVKQRLTDTGIKPTRVLLDPGFGFGTTFAEDRALWEALPALPRLMDWPVERICLGVSRKRFVARHFAGDSGLPAQDRDPATAEAHREALGWGYRVFRSHAI